MALDGLEDEELFLKAYALYLAGEKIKEQESIETSDSLDRTKVTQGPRGPNLTACACYSMGFL